MLPDQLEQEFRQQLRARYEELREEIRRELLESEDEHFIDLAGEVHDREEQSVADLLVDLDLAILDLHIDEIRDIDAAFSRLAQGTYGECIDCGTDIAVERLRAFPTAKRCQPCQVRYDQTHATRRTPSL